MIGHRPAKSPDEVLQGLFKAFVGCRAVRIDGLQQPLHVLAEAERVVLDALDPIGIAGRVLQSRVQLVRLDHDFVDGDRR